MLAFSCQYWKCLPREGGLFDQPAGLMERMTQAMNVYNAFTGYLHAGENAAEFAKQNPALVRIIEQVGKLREQKNG